jgi:O-methyltransferase involved in polyketide biosynthesis
MAQHNGAHIGLTAHYTGYTWFRNGLSHPAFATSRGQGLFAFMRPFDVVARRLGSPTVEGLLLARHRAIDAELERAIERGEVGQVVEIAAGLSPRGWHFKQRHGARLRYIEADLPHMAAFKLDLLQRAGLLTAGHEVLPFDATAVAGPLALQTVVARLDARVGTAFITEGLLMYLDRPAVLGLWRHVAEALRGFAGGVYLSDLHLAADNRSPLVRPFRALLSAAVRGQVQWHFDAAPQALQALREAGFDDAQLLDPREVLAGQPLADPAGAAMVRVITARARPGSCGRAAPGPGTA